MNAPTCTNEEGHEADAMQADYEYENCLSIRCMYCPAYVIVTIGDDQWLSPEPEWSAGSAENRARVDEPELVCGDCLSYWGAQDGAVYRVVPVDDCPQDPCHGKRLLA